MNTTLCELPRVIIEPIGTTGAEILITHVGADSDGLPRARISITRANFQLAADVIRLDRKVDRSQLTRAALKAERTRRVEKACRSCDGETNVTAADTDREADLVTSGHSAVPLTSPDIERALLRLGETLRTVGLPPKRPAGLHTHNPNAMDVVPRAERPEIVIRSDLADFVDEVERLLLASPNNGIYKRAGMLVRVLREQPSEGGGLIRPFGAPVIDTINVPHLRDRMARAARWFAPTQKGVRPVIPPKWVSETLLARGEWPFPRLAGVIETPTLRPDGTVIEMPGYDPATALLYESNTEFPSIPSVPSKDQILTAEQVILEPFSEFPFVAESDRCAAIAAVLTILGRLAIDGPTPLFAIRATTPGSGKGLLASTISLIGTGREPTLFAFARDDEEIRKRLLTIGLEGTRCVLLDNVEGVLGSPALAAALTAREITDRLLGMNRLVTVPMDAVWLTTGNNIVFGGDLGRRVVPIDLDPKVEFPEDRKFQRENLSRWVREERPRLVTAALTLLRAFYVAGCPGHGRARMGSFEEWDSVIRAALLWMGFGDITAGRCRIRNESGMDQEAIETTLDAWWRAFGSEPQTLARAIKAAFKGGHQDLAAVLAGLDPKCDGQQPNTRVVGDCFRRWKGRIAGELTLQKDDKKEHGAALWRVVRVEENEPKGVGELGESLSSNSSFSGTYRQRQEEENGKKKSWEKLGAGELDSPDSPDSLESPPPRSERGSGT